MTHFTSRQRLASLIILTIITAIGSPQVRASEAEWVTRSNEYAQPALTAMARFSPEAAGSYGVDGVDENVRRIGSDAIEQQNAAYQALAEHYRQEIIAEEDLRIEYDLRILISALEDSIESQNINQQHMLPYYDPAAIVFSGIRALMDPQVAEERKPAAITRLNRYAGLEDGYTPISDAAIAMTTDAMANAGLVGPFGPQMTVT